MLRNFLAIPMDDVYKTMTAKQLLSNHKSNAESINNFVFLINGF